MSKTADLNIIILTHNSQFWLKKTLETLKENYLDKTKLKVEVVVVDNNSQDDTQQMIKKHFKWVKSIKLDENKGYAVSNNLALKESTARYTALVNSDVEFTPKSNLDLLIKFMDSYPQVGIVTPRIEFVDGQIDPACHRGEPTLWASFTYMSGLESLFPHSSKFGQYHHWYKDLSSIHTIDACSGATMIIRTSAIKKVGLLDERFFMYAEDLDWCKRFRASGYKIVFFPIVVVIHHKYKSGLHSQSAQIARQTSSYFYDTMLQYYDKHYQDSYPKFIRTIIKYFVKLKKGVS